MNQQKTDFLSLKTVENRLSARKDLIKKLNQFQNEQEPEEKRILPTRDKRKRVREALVSVGNMKMYYRYHNCFYGPNKETSKEFQICSSPYCANCRNNLAKQAQSKVLERLNHGKWDIQTLTKRTPLLFKEYETIYRRNEYKNEDLRHITGVLGICPTRSKDVEKLLKEDSIKWRRIRRRINKEIDSLYWIETVYEYELVNWKYLKDANGSDFKKQQFEQLIKTHGKKYKEHTFLFVHFHGLTNLTKEKIYSVFQDEYHIDNKPLLKTDPATGLYIQSLHKNKSLEENVKKITSYPFKDAYRFKHSFVGSDFSNGEYLTSEELGRLITVYSEVQGRGNRTLFRSISNDIDLWNSVESELHTKIEMTRKHATKYRKSDRGKESLRLLIHLVDTMNRLKNRKGNISVKDLTTVITNDLTRNQIIQNRKLPWKVSEPFPVPVKYARKS